MPGSSSWGSQLRHHQLGENGLEWGKKQRHLLQGKVCLVSREKDGQIWGVDIVSGFKTDEAQLVSIPVKVNTENGSIRDVVDS